MSDTLNLHADILDVNERVDRLLHDAEHKDGGAMMARMMKDITAAKEFVVERNRLIAEAIRIDPERAAPAWQETSLS